MPTVQEAKQAVIEQPPQKTLKEMVKEAAHELGKALPAHMNPERIVRIALTCINQNPELLKCTPISFMGSLFVLAQLGLEPIAGRAYLLPFNNKRKIGNDWKTFKEVQAVIGYKGYVDLFYRHDAALAIDMQTVCVNDEFSYEYGTASFLRHRPKQGDRGEALGYYAIAKLRGGVHTFRYMSKEECMAHGQRHSKTFKEGKFSDYSPWSTDPDSMCMKTVLLQLSKLLPISIELQRAISVDETSRDYREGIQDTFDLPATTSYVNGDNQTKRIPDQSQQSRDSDDPSKLTDVEKKEYEVV